MVPNKQQRLKMDGKEYIALFETMSLGVVYQDKDGFIISANPAAEEVLGLTIDQMQGRTSTDPRWRSVHEDMSDFPGETHPAMVALKTGEDVKNVIMGVYNPKNESYTWIKINATPQFKNDELKPYQVYTTFEDITDRKNAELALLESEKSLNTAQHIGNIGSWEWNIQTGTLKWSDELYKIYGVNYKTFNLTMDSFTKFIHSDDLEKINEIINQIITEGSSSEFDFRIMRDDGSTRTLRTIVEVTEYDKDGNPLLVVGSNQDITERKKTEEKYRNALDNMMEGCQIISPDWRYIYVNDSAARHGRHQKEDLLGHTMMEKYPAIKDTEMFLKLKMTMETKESQQMENYFTYPDGKGMWFELRVFPVPEGIFILSIDIDERKKLENALIESEEKYKNLFDLNPNYVILSDLDGIILDVNIKLNELIGVSKQDLIGKNPIELGLFHKKDIDLYQKNFSDLLIKGYNDPFEGRIVDKNGKVHLLQYATTIIKKEPHNQILIIGSDITLRKKTEEALEESEERLRFVTDNMTDVIGQIDHEGNLTYFSPSLKHLTGFEPREVIGKSASDFVHPDDVELVNKSIMRAIDAKKVISIEYRALKSDGGYVWVEATGNSVFDEDGNFKSIIFTRRDISDRKKAEKKLKESENRLNAFINAINEAAFMIDIEGNYLMVNDALSKRLGIPKKDLIGKNAFKLLSKEVSTGRINYINKAIETGESQTFSDIRGDIYLNNHIYPVFDTNGNINRLAIFSMDVTNIRKTEKALRETEKQYENIVETTQEGVWVLDADATTSYVNQSMADMLGYSIEEMMGKPLFYFMDEEGKKDAARKMEKRRNGVKEIHDFKFTHKDGKDVWTMISTNPLFNENDEFSGVLGMLTDITDRINAERELKASEESYKNLFEGNPNYTILLSSDGLVLDINLSAEQVSGLSKMDVIGKHFTELEIFPPDELEKFGMFYNMHSYDEIEPYELRIFDKNKDIRLLEVMPTLINKDEEPLNIMLICKDITERKEMEDKIHDNLLRLDISLESAGLGVFDIDMVHDTTIRTPNHDKIFGYDTPLPKWGFTELFEHIIPEDREEIKKLIKNVAGQEKFHFKCRINRVDKEIRWIDVYGKVFYTEKGSPYRTLGVISDITGIKNSEEALKNLLTEKDALLKEIHHRVKNNLQIIISLLNLQEEHVQSEETKTVLTDSQSRIMSMADIHENLYKSNDLSHINFKEYVMKLISDIFYTYGVQQDKIKFIIHMEDNEQNMETAIPLGLIINELVTNSLKHAFSDQEKGSILVEMKIANRDKYELTIADDGRGVPEEININESLGLQIVYNLVNQINGQIIQDTSQGTKYTITFKELTYRNRI